MTELVLLRHGVTAWNRAKRFQGHIDIPLDDEGHRQARLAARRLAREPVAAVYASDLGRAVQTAMPIAEALGLPLQSEPGLRERHYGAFEGLDHDALQRDHADAYVRWREREPDFALPGGGETLRTFHARVDAALRRIVLRHPGKRVVAVTHGGVLDCVYRIASGLDLTAPRRHDLLNASLNRIAWDGARFRLLVWADVDHLGAALDDIEARA
ncbi:MAG TPA: histidine phosphatase family protein [Quisquiliibacterium sp.]|nr:histidine phosphatase family protein [Quisquiliibacterium sp.]